MPTHFLSPKGFRAAGVAAGIKQSKKNDVGLLIADAPVSAAAAFTTNKVFAAPVLVGREHVASGTLRGVVLNSGNANACTGRRGEKDARAMCSLAAELLGGEASDYLPSSTGIIGHHLPMDRVEAGVRDAFNRLGSDEEHASSFTQAILTTDTRPKFASASFKLGRERVTLTGICKGAGMIGPNILVDGFGSAARATRTANPQAGKTETERVGASRSFPPLAGSQRNRSASNPKQATMLAYLLTDALIAPSKLKRLLQDASAVSFNCVTIDDHMSTNDTAVLLASGASGAKVSDDASMSSFAAALRDVSTSLAQQIAADGEGATKKVTVRVTGAATAADANKIARAIANSPLVKCALNGNDPNWGRIVSAAGMCGATFDPATATLKLQGTTVFKSGTPARFDPESVSAAMNAPELLIALACNAGDGAATVWTCDFSKEYVSINADYHT